MRIEARACTCVSCQAFQLMTAIAGGSGSALTSGASSAAMPFSYMLRDRCSAATAFRRSSAASVALAKAVPAFRFLPAAPSTAADKRTLHVSLRTCVLA